MSPQQKIEKKGLLMCITRKDWWLKSGMGYFILSLYCTFSIYNKYITTKVSMNLLLETP